VADTGWVNRERRSRLLAHIVIIASVAGDADRARTALAELDQALNEWSTPAQQALSQRARAELAAAEGRFEDAVDALRDSRRLWDEIGARVRSTIIRLRTAELLLAVGDTATAGNEVAAAARNAQAVGIKPVMRRCEEIQARVRAG
jgi:ATP/maltotriose-dependent transcriptional regulator MalT